MGVKTILYIVSVPVVIWALDAINISNLFKKNKYWQARFIYVILALALSYLVVNFFYDFYLTSSIL